MALRNRLGPARIRGNMVRMMIFGFGPVQLMTIHMIGDGILAVQGQGLE